MMAGAIRPQVEVPGHVDVDYGADIDAAAGTGVVVGVVAAAHAAAAVVAS